MIQTLKLRIDPIRPHLNYALWLNNLVVTELALFGLQWLICYWLVWMGVFFSIIFGGAVPALVAANGWYFLSATSIAAFALWVFDCAARMRRGSYMRKDVDDGSPS